jgi:hypothetical protein
VYLTFATREFQPSSEGQNGSLAGSKTSLFKEDIEAFCQGQEKMQGVETPCTLRRLNSLLIYNIT